MHGRVKVRTSEEEKARKEHERQEKLKIFKHAMTTIQEKRKAGELDKELLELTGKVLTTNPDIYTFWNIRREILIRFRDAHNAENEMALVYYAELQLTEYCLTINPKSYCAWHQREWVLTNRPDPDWNKELAVCNKYLNLDERNFHTWDYRRFVVAQCKPPLTDEFNFTTEKLHDNFSNYSAWHYRSKMLVKLHPDKLGGRPIEDRRHKHELKMVQSAAFTDPDDTSAWFYQRWLLGAVKKTIHLVVCTVTESKTSVAFSEYVNKSYVESKTKIFINHELVNGDWISCSGNDYDVLWILNHSQTILNDLDIKVEYEEFSGEKHTISCLKKNDKTYIGKGNIDFQKKYSEPVIEELNNQLTACRQLLDLEPDSKWTLLTTTVFLHCIDPKRYYQETIANLHTLKTIDKLRTGYYADMITKWSIEDQLSANYNTNDSLDFKIMSADKITCLPHLQFYSYCEIVDLSNQVLTSKVLPSLVVLQHCKKLSLENNLLTTLKGFPNLSLEEINLKGNNQLSVSEVAVFKKKNIKCQVIFNNVIEI